MSKIPVLALAALAAAFALPAMAADPVYETGEYPPTPEYEAPLPFDWSGAYIGAHGGLSFADRPNPFRDRNGLSGGVQAGYNLQAGTGIVGVEVEGSYLGDADHKVRGGRIEEKWRGAVKARAGLSFDRTLVYGTAGYALTKFKAGQGLRDSGEWKGGYLLGGGVEQGFAGGLSAKVEYNYVTTPDVKTTTARGRTSQTDINGHVLKAGVNYRF